MSDTRAKLERLIAEWKPGTVLMGERTPYWACFVSVAKEQYVLVASWLTNESYDDDPESYHCGCPLAGKSHEHAEQRVGKDEVGRLADEYDRAIGLLERKRPVRFGGER